MTLIVTEGKDMISFYHLPSIVFHFNHYLSNTSTMPEGKFTALISITRHFKECSEPFLKHYFNFPCFLSIILFKSDILENIKMDKLSHFICSLWCL